ncbi:MAG TPA: hypothetical protein GX519_01600 [Thermoanaerobacterales bacterium]|nr:hypothetical protein [Thermoanaerobacterales bacterium]
MVYGLILIFIVIVFLEVPGLLREKLWRELIAFSVLLSIGFILSFLQVISVKIPSPNDGIIFLIETISKGLR